MTKTRIIIVACFCVAFAAGIAVGWVAGKKSPPPPPPEGSWLERELELSPEQREQMRQIWSGLLEHSRQEQRQRRDALQQERDDALRAMLSEEEQAKWEEVKRTYAQEAEALDVERRMEFDKAVEKTKEILTQSQKVKYEELLKQRREGSRRRHSRLGPPDLPSRDAPASPDTETPAAK